MHKEGRECRAVLVSDFVGDASDGVRGVHGRESQDDLGSSDRVLRMAGGVVS